MNGLADDAVSMSLCSFDTVGLLLPSRVSVCLLMRDFGDILRRVAASLVGKFHGEDIRNGSSTRSPSVLEDGLGDPPEMNEIHHERL